MFAYCLNNPINLSDPYGTIPFYDEPVQKFIEDFLEWYYQTDEDETDENGKRTFPAKVKKTIMSFVNNLEFSAGVGVGLGEELNILNIDEAIYSCYDIIAVQYCAGQWSFGQRIAGSLSASLTQAFEFGGGFDAFRDFNGTPNFVGWIVYNNKKESWTLFSFSFYDFFIGGNLEVSFDLNTFLYEFSNI